MHGYIPAKVIEMKNLLTILFYTTLILFSSLSMAAVERPTDQAASCTEGITKHHAGPPGKGIVHYGRKDCRRVDIAAFERSKADATRDVAAGDHEVKIGKPVHNRRLKNQ